MAYAIKPNTPVGAELKRLVRKQLHLARVALASASTSRQYDTAVHAARRHIKKARAIGRLLDGRVAPSFGPTNRQLRSISRLLGPLTDGASVIDTLRRARNAHGADVARDTFALVHKRLLRRKRRMIHRARVARVLETAARELHAEELTVAHWIFRKDGFTLMAPGLRRAYRNGRKAVWTAAETPSTEAFHAWRRRAKDQWFHLRLLDERCAGQLGDELKRLETLDGVLGEYHNCTVLQHAVMTESLDSRYATSQVLRVLRAYARQLRHDALALGAAVYRDRPVEFVARVRSLWDSTAGGSARDVKVRPWRRVA